MSALPECIIWTDGSCSSSKHGGWAALVVRWVDGEPVRMELAGHQHPTTNNAMELLAAIEGLASLEGRHHVYLVSDSAYMLDALREKWDLKWLEDIRQGAPERPNWRLWLRLRSLVDEHQVEYVKVRGHTGDHFNEIADKLAGAARRAGQKAHGDSNPRSH